MADFHSRTSRKPQDDSHSYKRGIRAGNEVPIEQAHPHAGIEPMNASSVIVWNWCSFSAHPEPPEAGCSKAQGPPRPNLQACFHTSTNRLNRVSVLLCHVNRQQTEGACHALFNSAAEPQCSHSQRNLRRCRRGPLPQSGCGVTQRCTCATMSAPQICIGWNEVYQQQCRLILNVTSGSLRPLKRPIHATADSVDIRTVGLP
jgi:hypothetical protein